MERIERILSCKRNFPSTRLTQWFMATTKTPSRCWARTRSRRTAAGRWRCGRSCRSPAGLGGRPGPGSDRPMRRIHPAGLFEAIVDEHGDRNDIRLPGPSPRPQLPTPRDLQVRRDHTMHDPYAFPPLLTDYDLHLLGEGQALAELREARRPPAHGRRRDRRELRRLGPERRERQRRRRLQRLGRPPPPDAQAHPQRHLGAVRPRPGRGHALQVRGASIAASTSSRSPIPTASPPSCRRARANIVADLDDYQWNDARVDGQRAAAPTRSTRRCRSTKCTSAAGGATRRRSRRAGSTIASWPTSSSTTASRWASRTSSCCRSASIRSPAAGATRRSATSPPPAATARRKTSCTSSITATRTASA